MISTNEIIKKVEDKWLEVLSQECKNIFKGKGITSHDHTHHFRVWKYCKDILKALEANGLSSYDLAESCIIASFFHDTGLTINLNKNHGKESAAICKKFFEKKKFDKPGSFNEILNAIEKHDDKDYKETEKQPSSLFSVVCSADDMDAFGNIGIIRYTEIYLMRDIGIYDLPNLVIENLDKRFSHFKQLYQNYNELFNRHKSKYLITRNAFIQLKDELEKESL